MDEAERAQQSEETQELARGTTESSKIRRMRTAFRGQGVNVREFDRGRVAKLHDFLLDEISKKDSGNFPEELSSRVLAYESEIYPVFTAEGADL